MLGAAALGVGVAAQDPVGEGVPLGVGVAVGVGVGVGVGQPVELPGADGTGVGVAGTEVRAEGAGVVGTVLGLALRRGVAEGEALATGFRAVGPALGVGVGVGPVLGTDPTGVGVAAVGPVCW